MTDSWWDKLEKTIDAHSLLKHPFYQAWQAGKLSFEDLRCYARQYYPHVAHFPRYVSAVHSNCSDIAVRQQLLENLIEEERGSENHPELWLRFAEGIGVPRSEVFSASIQPETKECVEIFTALSQDENAQVGLAGLYAYESQLPAICRTKLQGLSDFYGINDERTRAFFKIHQTADVWHSKEERDMLVALAKTESEREDILWSTETACQAVWRLLDGICETQKICSTC
jgi:pyrroloquinoline-quinone synthase